MCKVKLALRNALRYFPSSLHEKLAPEFAEELRNYGHIYMYRFRPSIDMRAYPVGEYPTENQQCASIMLMIMNVLDPRVAQFPQELVTYGGNGQVFSNWAQFRLTMHYLSTMTYDQTLVMCSGHPQGLFPSLPSSPRLVITNGMVVPNYSSRQEYDRLFALGVTMYGQMTAGSYCYIGPQGIVHGTTLTILNASRLYLKTSNLAGLVFVTSGLGGMSGAQAKAAVICGCIGVIAEICPDAMRTRCEQGWVSEQCNDLDELVTKVREYKRSKKVASIGYLGNVVDVWRRFAEEFKNTGELLPDLGSDQTSLHNPYLGGYYPVQITYEESLEMMHKNPAQFKELVSESLRMQVESINLLADGGMRFWDYGNAFLLEAKRAGANVDNIRPENGREFAYPSYVQDIMGDIFSLGFGPFRWVCSSGDPSDLALTDELAFEVMQKLIDTADPNTADQYKDNMKWIKEAGGHKLVVGSQARILYSDQRGRIEIAISFNKAVSDGRLKAPVVLSRDHHDVSGTDSPYRETSNVYDGSSRCADMAVQNCIGDSFRGATWVALHNGGGVGWGEVINGGFGLVLDGSEDARRRAETMLAWDVSNGVTRRAWSGNVNANQTIRNTMQLNDKLKVTLANDVLDEEILKKEFN